MPCPGQAGASTDARFELNGSQQAVDQRAFACSRIAREDDMLHGVHKKIVAKARSGNST